MVDKVYNYDPALTNTHIYDYRDMIVENNKAECPILGCRVLAEDCSTPLSAPYASLITT